MTIIEILSLPSTQFIFKLTRSIQTHRSNSIIFEFLASHAYVPDLTPAVNVSKEGFGFTYNAFNKAAD